MGPGRMPGLQVWRPAANPCSGSSIRPCQDQSELEQSELSLLGPWQHPGAVTAGLQGVTAPFHGNTKACHCFPSVMVEGERGSLSEGREEKKGNLVIFFFLTGFTACMAERPVRGQILRELPSLLFPS